MSTHQKSTFGASLRLTKYSSFIAASCKAMAVSKSASRPVLRETVNFVLRFNQHVLHFENFVGSLPDDERSRVGLGSGAEISQGNRVNYALDSPSCTLYKLCKVSVKEQRLWDPPMTKSG